MPKDDYKSRAAQRAKERNTSNWYKLAEGDNCFRILQTPESKTTPSVFIEYDVHRDVGPKRQKVRCGKDLRGEGDCYLCDKVIPALRKKGQDTRAVALEPRGETIVQIAKVNEDGDMTGPFIWSPSKTIADQLIASVFTSKKRDYADSENGYNLSLSRTGTGKNDTRYGIIEPDVESSEVPEAIVKKLKPFSELKEIPTYSEAKQKAAYTGSDYDPDDDDEEETVEEPESEDDDEEEEAKPRGKDKPVPVKGKKKPEPEPDEDEELSETEDEEESEPEPPKKVTGKKKPVPVDDDKEDENVEIVKPQPKKVAGKPTKKVVQPETEDDEELDLAEDDEDDVSLDDEEEEPEPPKKVVKKKK
jgi:hypothetical protein